MIVCKQPVATLALNATSSYVVMIREWGRHRLFYAVILNPLLRHPDAVGGRVQSNLVIAYNTFYI